MLVNNEVSKLVLFTEEKPNKGKISWLFLLLSKHSINFQCIIRYHRYDKHHKRSTKKQSVLFCCQEIFGEFYLILSTSNVVNVIHAGVFIFRWLPYPIGVKQSKFFVIIIGKILSKLTKETSD